MPKYDAATLNELTRKIRLYVKATEISKERCIEMGYWDEYVDEYQKGMDAASRIIIEIIDEMRHTAKKHDKKA